MVPCAKSLLFIFFTYNSLEIVLEILCVCVLVAQSCPILCDPKDCCLPGFSVPGIFSGKNTGVGCHFLLQGIFLTQGLNLGLPHCRKTLYCLSHQESLTNINCSK